MKFLTGYNGHAAVPNTRHIQLVLLRHLYPSLSTRPQRTGYAGGLLSEKERTRAGAPSEQPQPGGRATGTRAQARVEDHHANFGSYPPTAKP